MKPLSNFIFLIYVNQFSIKISIFTVFILLKLKK